MTECVAELPYDFYDHRPLVVRFSDLQLSSDAGILLARQVEEKVQVCRRIADCIEDWRDPNKITHSLHQLVSQRVYQLVGGYEDANDSNVLRHDPIFKIACERLPIAEPEQLASQPTITRLENHVGKAELARMRSQMVDHFIASYHVSIKEIVGFQKATLNRRTNQRLRLTILWLKRSQKSFQAIGHRHRPDLRGLRSLYLATTIAPGFINRDDLPLEINISPSQCRQLPRSAPNPQQALHIVQVVTVLESVQYRLDFFPHKRFWHLAIVLALGLHLGPRIIRQLPKFPAGSENRHIRGFSGWATGQPIQKLSRILFRDRCRRPFAEASFNVVV
jgi:hypothetical protein